MYKRESIELGRLFFSVSIQLFCLDSGRFARSRTRNVFLSFSSPRDNHQLQDFPLRYILLTVVNRHLHKEIRQDHRSSR